MSHYIIYNLSINHIENFSLLKEKKSKIFGIYKNTKYKYLNLYNKIFFIPRKDILKVKEISLDFIETVKKDNNVLIKNNTNIINPLNLIYHNNDDTLLSYESDPIKKLIKNKSKYCKKANKNDLIKPVLYEDNLKNAQVEDVPKNSGFINKYISYNKYLIDSFIKKYNFDLSKENYFKNVDKNLLFEKKLSPILEKSNIFENLNKFPNNNEINELNQLKLNNKSVINKYKEEEIISKEKTNFFTKNFSTQESTFHNNINNHKLSSINKSKGRKCKNSSLLNEKSTHTKHSPDNMMRKIKNKVIESSRLLVNKVLNEEIKNNRNITFNLIHKEFRKIKGCFGQELNIKYNFWFYQITIKDIFTLEISNKYTATEKSSNKEIIEFIDSPLNNKNFIKTKKLLNTPFHQYYHDIFLNEEPNWKIYYGINEKDNKYQIDYLLNNLDEEEKGQSNNENSQYIKNINSLAHRYEEFFLEKRPRNIEFNNKKNDFIKDFMNNTLNDKYSKLSDEVKKFKIFYENRNLLNKEQLNLVLPNQKSDETQENSLIKINNLNTNNKEIINIKNNKNYNINIDNIKNEDFDLNLKNNIALKEEQEEEKKENYDENMIKSKKTKTEMKAPLNNEISKNQYIENIYSLKKRKVDKIKYNISCE
jgi:hypothetical protein